MTKNELIWIRPGDITIGERFRKNLLLDSDFIASIAEKGVLQPVTISDKHELVAGGRRVGAAIELGIDEIPALVRHEMDELDLRECELIENVYREDLGWTERARLVSRIDSLMREKHAINEHQSTWSQSKTADILNRSVGGINRNLKMAEALEQFPKLAELPTEDDAVKMLRKLKEAVAARALAKQHIKRHEKDPGDIDETGIILSSRDFDSDQDPRISVAMKAASHYRIGDAIKGMEDIAEDDNLRPPIAFVEVDPPYGIDLYKKKKGDKTIELNLYDEIPKEDYSTFLAYTCNSIYNCTPKSTRGIFWFGIEWYQSVRYALEGAGFDVDPIPCIWAKMDENTKPSGQTNNPELYLARSWEPFFVFWKGDGIPIKERGRSNLFTHKVVPASRKYHPTQRPIGLMQDILKTFAWPGTIMMVPFLGSGATLIAGYREGMMGWGWDTNEANYEPFLAAVETDIEEYYDDSN